MAVDDTKTKATTKPAQANKGFTDEEKAAMRQRAKEQKAAAGNAAGEADALAAIAAMQAPDRAMAERIHALIATHAPTLAAKTWYGMPAYATAAGKITCFFQPAAKFKTRYATFGFNDSAHLDDGGLWPVAFALTQLNAAEEAQIVALVKKAVS